MNAHQYLHMYKILGLAIPEKYQDLADEINKHELAKRRLAAGSKTPVGFGTAVFEVSNDGCATNPYARRDSCLCCEKKRRFMTYEYSIGGWLCESCKPKVMNNSMAGVVDVFGLLVTQSILQDERELSRHANKAYNSGPPSDPREFHKWEPKMRGPYKRTNICPVCGSAGKVDLTEQRNIYYCNHCGKYFKYTGKYYFWENQGVVNKCYYDGGTRKLVAIRRNFAR